MACHTINIACMALELFDPESVDVIDTSGIVDHQTYATWSIIRTQFGPRNRRGPLTMTWYDGGDKFPDSKKVYKEMIYGEKVPDSGLLLVGEKGSFFSQNDYGAEHVLLPREKFSRTTRTPSGCCLAHRATSPSSSTLSSRAIRPRRCRTSTTPAA